MVKEISNSNVVHRLRAININDKDIWADKDVRRHIEYWEKNQFPHGAPEVMAYIPITQLIKNLNEDIRKLKLARELDSPYNVAIEQIGSVIHVTGEWGDDGEASIDTLIDYIENLIKHLEDASNYTL